MKECLSLANITMMQKALLVSMLVSTSMSFCFPTLYGQQQKHKHAQKNDTNQKRKPAGNTGKKKHAKLLKRKKSNFSNVTRKFDWNKFGKQVASALYTF